MARRTRVPGPTTGRHRLPRNYCFACGPDNPDGMHLKFHYHADDETFVCRFRLARKYTGPPGHCHGGVIAAILDEAMGKVNKIRQVVALTKEIEIEYVRPVPLHQPLTVVSWEKRVSGRVHINMAEILNQKGDLLAQGRGTFIAIDPIKMFAKYMKAKRAARSGR